MWNRGGVAPEGIDELTRLARLVKPEAVVWRRRQLDDQQSVRIRGVPIGSAAFDKSAEQETLFHRPLSVRSCSVRPSTDAFGHDRAACATAGEVGRWS